MLTKEIKTSSSVFIHSRADCFDPANLPISTFDICDNTFFYSNYCTNRIKALSCRNQFQNNPCRPIRTGVTQKEASKQRLAIRRSQFIVRY